MENSWLERETDALLYAPDTLLVVDFEKKKKRDCDLCGI